MNKEFEEKNAITIPVNYKSFIYFLLKNNIVVYVGQTKRGLFRPFSHKDKDYDEMKIILCEEKILNDLEDKFIIKYKPKYNRTVNNSYSLINVRNRIRRKFNNKITVLGVKKIIKFMNIKLFEYNGNLYINNDDYEKIIKYIERVYNGSI